MVWDGRGQLELAARLMLRGKMFQQPTDETLEAAAVGSPRFDVSVIVAAYDVSADIDRALRSVLAQTASDIEVIVVNDASSDDTVHRVARHAAADCWVRLIRQQRNRSPARVRNAAFHAAQGCWIAVLDADDAWGRPGCAASWTHRPGATWCSIT